MTTHDLPLDLAERVGRALQIGESHFREFKSALEGPPGSKVPRAAKVIRRDIGEALVAFANADGGSLIVGVEDDGTVTGVPHSPADIASFLDAPTSHVHPETPLPPCRRTQVSLNELTVLYFQIDKSTRLVHLTNDGRCLQRRDLATLPIPSEQIRFERQEQISREYDRAFVDGAVLSDLDIEVLERVGSELAPGMSAEKLLQLLELAEYGDGSVRLRRAALLLFGQEIRRWHPRSEVRVLRIAGTELKPGRDYNVTEDRVVGGSVLELLSQAWEEIRPHLVQTRLGPDGVFQEQIRYPEDAVREALTNAIAHRDYSAEGRGIEVLVFDDRMEVRSPGGLLANVTVSDLRQLKGLHQSRNTHVTRVLRELRYMREMGEGMRRIFQLMVAHDFVAPELSADGESFSIALHHRSIFSEEARRWLQAYEVFNLSREEQKVLLLGRDGKRFSMQQVWDALDLVDTEDYRIVIASLQQKGLLLGLKKSSGGRDKRNFARWSVRPAPEANEAYLELMRALQGSGIAPSAYITPADLGRVTAKLDRGHPYGSGKIGASLLSLGLMDSARSPSGALLAMLEADPVSREADRRPRETPPAPRPADRGRESESGPPEVPAKPLRTPTLYVGNLANEVTPAELEAAFGGVGHVRRVTVPRDVSTGLSQGFAFVVMGSVSDAAKALEEMEGVSLRGRRMRLDWSKPRRGSD